MKKKNILLTGGCGFVGKNIIQALYKKYNLIVVDNLSSGNVENIPKKIEIKKIDIKNNNQINKIFKKYRFHAVIHCAANFANQSSIENIYNDTHSNIIGTINLLENCKFFNVINFIYLSSSCVYSESESNENILNPSFKTPYAISKFTAEQYVSFYNYYYKINSSIFRLYNFYGPYDYTGKYRNVIPNFIYKALNNKTIYIHGRGLSTRDFTYVLDFTNVLADVINRTKKYNKVYNFGASKKVKIIDLAKKIIKLTNSKSKIKFIPSRQWDTFSKRKAKNQRLKKDFKNLKFTNFDKGLKETVKWFNK